MGFLFKNDRQLSDEKISEQRSYWVVEHNDLISCASYDLTAKELKIMDFIISRIKSDDTKFHKVDTSLYEMNKVMNLNVRSGQNYNNMAQTLRELMKKIVQIYDNENRKAIFTHWIQEIEISENGRVSVQLSDKLMPFLLQLKGNYTQYRLFDTVQLNSKYSIRLYKLMREADKNYGKSTPYIQVTPEKLAKLLSSPNNYTFGQFNQKVLQPAIEEINLKIEDMDLICHQFKEGRRVVELEIYNNFYPIQTIKNGENIDPVPMINWVKNMKDDLE